MIGTAESWKGGTHLITAVSDKMAVLVIVAVLVLITELKEVMKEVLVDTVTEVLVAVLTSVRIVVLVLVDVVVNVLKNGLLLLLPVLKPLRRNRPIGLSFDGRLKPPVLDWVSGIVLFRFSGAIFNFGFLF